MRLPAAAVPPLASSCGRGQLRRARVLGGGSVSASAEVGCSWVAAKGHALVDFAGDLTRSSAPRRFCPGEVGRSWTSTESTCVRRRQQFLTWRDRALVGGGKRLVLSWVAAGRGPPLPGELKLLYLLLSSSRSACLKEYPSVAIDDCNM